MAGIGSILDGKYEILKEIGHGGMSVVYLAMDRHLNKQWAVKEIRKQGRNKKDEIVVNSLIAEANLMKKLDHPALPRIVDIIEHGDKIYIIMDYIEGESLDNILKQEGPQDEKKVISWARQLCDALAYLHGQKPPIIYRDMKPANIMLKPEGTIKIIDFGIAREYKEGVLSDTTVLGTNGYAAPEQYGSRQTDPRTDIYGLGMTMHHLLTGMDPRPKDYIYAPIRQWNPELSEGMEVIVDKCTQPAAENRYQSAEELMYDLQHPDLITEDYRKKQQRKLRRFLVVAGLSLAFLAGGIGSQVYAGRLENNSYDSLISVVESTDYAKKVDNYKRAIAIFPADLRAYHKLIDAYEDHGNFSKTQNDELLALYNANKDKFDKSSESLFQLNYRIGMMYFNYYYDENGQSSFATRIQKAFPFFEYNETNPEVKDQFQGRKLSRFYYDIASFYKKYILNSSNVVEASSNEYKQLFKEVDEIMDLAPSAGSYDQLTLYNSLFLLIHDQRNLLANARIPEDQILNLYNRIFDKAKAIVVQKKPSQRLQKEIVSNYHNYYESIRRSYRNEEKRRDKEKQEQEEGANP